MIIGIILLLAGFTWLLLESQYLTIRLLVGKLESFDPQPQVDQLYQDWIETLQIRKRISWSVCLHKYGYKQIDFTKYNEVPICGWEWLEKNTHPIPEVTIDIEAGGVRHTMTIKDPTILKPVVNSLHYNRPKPNGQLHFRRNNLGGLVAPLPPKVKR